MVEGQVTYSHQKLFPPYFRDKIFASFVILITLIRSESLTVWGQTFCQIDFTTNLSSLVALIHAFFQSGCEIPLDDKIRRSIEWFAMNPETCTTA